MFGRLCANREYWMWSAVGTIFFCIYRIDYVFSLIKSRLFILVETRQTHRLCVCASPSTWIRLTAEEEHCVPLIRSGCRRERMRIEERKISKTLCVRCFTLVFFSLSWFHGCKALLIVRRHRWHQQQKKTTEKCSYSSGFVERDIKWIECAIPKCNIHKRSELSQGARTIKNLYIVRPLYRIVHSRQMYPSTRRRVYISRPRHIVEKNIFDFIFVASFLYDTHLFLWVVVVAVAFTHNTTHIQIRLDTRLTSLRIRLILCAGFCFLFA